MYSEKGKKVSVSTMRKAILKRIEYFNKNHNKKIIMRETDIDYAAISLTELNTAIIKGYQVFARCDKEPPGNLDTGNHYYSIHYCWIEDKKPVTKKLWLYEFTRAVGGIVQDRMQYIDKYTFCSGAIGMSRKLDATDGVFSFLKSVSGVYCQL